jgi:hypothetical protein
MSESGLEDVDQQAGLRLRLETSSATSAASSGTWAAPVPPAASARSTAASATTPGRDQLVGVGMARIAKDALVGTWRSDPADPVTMREFGDASMEFDRAGHLTYTIHGQDKDEKMLLTYRVDGSAVITDQPSSPREEETAFEVTKEGKLVLDWGGVRARFVRVSW